MSAAGEKRKPDDKLLQRVVEMTKLRTMIEAYRRQNTEITAHMVRYAEAIGAMFSTSRPLLDRIHEIWPDIGEEECVLDPQLQQAIVSFRRTVYGLIPKEKLDETEEQHATDHSTGPGFPEGAEGPEAPTDPYALAENKGEDGSRPVHDGDAADPVEQAPEGQPPAHGGAPDQDPREAEGDAPPRSEV